MYHNRRPRKFRRRSNGRNHSSRGGRNGHMGMRPNLFSHEQQRNNFRPVHNPEKLLEKYNALAKEALSAGDKTLYENYLQHADHFMRLVGEKNKYQNQNEDKSLNKNNLTESNNQNTTKTNTGSDSNLKEKEKEKEKEK